ncbi:MAG TPA: hypothetical protein P5556_09635 [Candidatus Gastranaerophilales bacterium]|nr:hypothetical protein [Candidatus Gastranaerophilales bacterium]
MKINRIVKRLICIFTLLLLISGSAQAKTLEGGVDLNWPLLNQEEREKTINYYKDLLFKDVKYKIDKETLKPFKKDAKLLENRALLKNNIKKTDDRELAKFYFFNKVFIIYGVKYLEDKFHLYYYNVAGGLEYFDILDKPHDEYPHISYQYNKSGKLAGISYYISEYDQYIFDDKGKFRGRWYYSKLYDKKAKVILTRELP